MLTPTTWLARSVLAVGGCLALAATATGASASDLGVGVAPVAAPASQVADVQALTSRRDVAGGGKYAGVPAPAPVPAAAPEEGPLGIPGIPYAAYRGAEARMATEQPGCGISWTLLAGIGYVESTHVHNGRTDAKGTVLEKVLGPVLDGSGPGDGVVPDTDHGVLDGDPVYDRAVGPTQFLPATWAHYGADGNGDGIADPQNVFDSALGTAHYLCSGGMNLRDAGQVQTAVYRYNHSYEYVAKVTMWATAYLTGRSPSAGTTSSSSSSNSSGYSSSGSSSSGSGSSSGYSSSSSGGSGYSSSGSSGYSSSYGG
ncbi:lytic transglycosylase domain-containing protein [Rhodococcus aerolatus]